MIKSLSLLANHKQENVNDYNYNNKLMLREKVNAEMYDLLYS